VHDALKRFNVVESKEEIREQIYKRVKNEDSGSFTAGYRREKEEIK